MTCRGLFKKVFFISTFVLSCIALPAQVMWNLKGGIMPTEISDGGESEQALNWMAGLEIEFPLSQKLNIETGLRYKNAWESDNRYDEIDCQSHFEIPVRLAYKHKFRDNLSLHAGVGPYLGYVLHEDGGSNPEVGIEPSVAINWKCLSIGVTYTNSCFGDKKDYKKYSGPMLTVGVRLGSDKMKYVGAGLLAAGAVAGTIYAATQGDYSGSSYIPSSSYPSSSNSSTSSSPSNSDNSSSEAKLLDQYHRWERSAQGTYNALTNTGYKVKKEGKVVSGSTAQSWGISTYSEMKRLLREAQKEMKKIRIKAAKKGIDIPKSEYEDVQVKW